MDAWLRRSFLFYGSNHLEEFLRKSVLKIYSKFSGEHPCRSAISIKFAKQFYRNCTLIWVFSCKWAAYFQNTFSQNHFWLAASVFNTLWFPLSSSLIYFRYNHGVCTCDLYFSTIYTKGVDTKISLGVSNKNQDLIFLNIFDHLFLYTAYVDDTTFFLENKESIEEFVKTFTLFSSFSGLKPNFSKCEICGLGPLKGVQMAVCGMQTVDLTKDAVKILDIYFSYNINLMNQKNYCQTITSIHGILKLWRMRNLSIEGKIVVFKTLAIWHFLLVFLIILLKK